MVDFEWLRFRVWAEFGGVATRWLGCGVAGLLNPTEACALVFYRRVRTGLWGSWDDVGLGDGRWRGSSSRAEKDIEKLRHNLVNISSTSDDGAQKLNILEASVLEMEMVLERHNGNDNCSDLISPQKKDIEELRHNLANISSTYDDGAQKLNIVEAQKDIGELRHNLANISSTSDDGSQKLNIPEAQKDIEELRHNLANISSTSDDGSQKLNIPEAQKDIEELTHNDANISATSDDGAQKLNILEAQANTESPLPSQVSKVVIDRSIYEVILNPNVNLQKDIGELKDNVANISSTSNDGAQKLNILEAQRQRLEDIEELRDNVTNISSTSDGGAQKSNILEAQKDIEELRDNVANISSTYDDDIEELRDNVANISSASDDGAQKLNILEAQKDIEELRHNVANISSTSNDGAQKLNILEAQNDIEALRHIVANISSTSYDGGGKLNVLEAQANIGSPQPSQFSMVSVVLRDCDSCFGLQKDIEEQRDNVVNISSSSDDGAQKLNVLEAQTNIESSLPSQVSMAFVVLRDYDSRFGLQKDIEELRHNVANISSTSNDGAQKLNILEAQKDIEELRDNVANISPASDDSAQKFNILEALVNTESNLPCQINIEELRHNVANISLTSDYGTQKLNILEAQANIESPQPSQVSMASIVLRDSDSCFGFQKDIKDLRHNAANISSTSDDGAQKLNIVEAQTNIESPQPSVVLIDCDSCFGLKVAQVLRQKDIEELRHNVGNISSSSDDGAQKLNILEAQKDIEELWHNVGNILLKSNDGAQKLNILEAQTDIEELRDNVANISLTSDDGAQKLNILEKDIEKLRHNVANISSMSDDGGQNLNILEAQKDIEELRHNVANISSMSNDDAQKLNILEAQANIESPLPSQVSMAFVVLRDCDSCFGLQKDIEEQRHNVTNISSTSNDGAQKLNILEAQTNIESPLLSQVSVASIVLRDCNSCFGLQVAQLLRLIYRNDYWGYLQQFCVLEKA
ncbi:ankyrin repeat domain-containing protein 36B-like [Juglans microcarpa x Juglans regia]|uniref:ankyrin repeat domain-containing protein 36B-like n=1 Tax=Juglans microcarpa x Juglans regia TaxID=2249226 RepID=UPI001B7E0CF8|nr:ankyrin repeat domain-containing protein 36B-like [Juglans microcarpa x Juglans regia]